jgi:NAD(P)H-flavin reductase
LKNTSHKKIFIATGTGLSPIYYMMHASWEAEKVLYFGLRKQEDIFYLDELKKIPNLTVHIYLSQDETSEYNY